MKNVIGRTVSNGLKAFTVLAVFLAILLTVQVITTQMFYVRIQKAYPVQTETKKLAEAENRERRIYNSSIKYLPDGTIHLIYPTGKTDNRISQALADLYDLRGPDRFVKIYDVNDSLLWSGPETKIPYTYLKQANGFFPHSNQNLDSAQNLDPDFTRDLIFPVADAEGEKTEFWRYDFDRCYFTGYGRDKTLLGYCSASGFTDDKGSVVPFEPLRNLSAWIPVSSRSPQAFLLTKQRLWQVNFENRRLEKICESLESEISYVQMIDWRQLTETDPDSRPALLAGLKGLDYILILKDPHQVLPIQWPEFLSEDSGSFSLYSSGNSFYLVADWIQGAPDPSRDIQGYMKWRKENLSKPLPLRQKLFRVEENGTLSLLNHFEYTRPPYQPSASQILQNEKLDAMRRITSIFAPVSFSWIYSAIDQRYKSAYSQSLFGGFCMLVQETHPRAARFYYPISLVFVVIALIHALPRRTSWGRIAAWLVFIFCFNLAGFLTYLSLNHFPVICCISCGRRRGLNRPDCPACGAALPEPETRDVDLVYPPSGKPASA